MDNEIQMEAVVSSNVHSVGFDAATGRIRVKFKTGGLYEASGVTQADYDAFKSAKSIGQHFNKIMKTAFVFKKV